MNAMPESKKKLKAFFDEKQEPPKEVLQELHEQVSDQQSGAEN